MIAEAALLLASAKAPLDRHPPPTIPWVLAQLVPSPLLAFGGGSGRFGMRWQITPILYSWGLYRKLSPWRFFVVEPLTRTSGSLEAFVAPEIADLGPRPDDVFILSQGLRVTLPVIERGDYLSISFASGAWFHDGNVGGMFEWGAYTLFGILGFQFAIRPRLENAQYMFSLRLRIF